MSIKNLAQIDEAREELLKSNHTVRELERDIKAHQEYLQYIYSRFTKPKHTIDKYVGKILNKQKELAKEKKAQYELRKELAMLKQGHTYE